MFEQRKTKKIEGTVLLVDDDETVRNVGKELLEILGLCVITAEDGQQAVNIFKKSPNSLDCIILDLTMPHMNGQEAFSELRRIRDDIPIILSSGYTELDVTQQFSGKNLTGFIQKPYMLSTLTEILTKTLNKSRQKS